MQVATPGGEGAGGEGGVIQESMSLKYEPASETPARVRNELQLLREDQARGMAALREAEVFEAHGLLYHSA